MLTQQADNTVIAQASAREPLAPRLYPAVLAVAWVCVAVLALRPGLVYYTLPLHDRVFSPAHDALAPTGRIGHSFGIAGTFMMLIGVAGYSIRKRWSVLQRTGKLRYWLQTHIFLCTLGPFLVLLHTTFKFGGLVAIAFWSMTLVVLSGVFGRYVYVRIPKAVNGQFRTLQELRRERDEVTAAIAARLDGRLAALLEPSPASAVHGLRALIAGAALEFRTRRTVRDMRRQLLREGISPALVAGLAKLLERQARLERQVALLTPFQRLFRYWHVFHLPFAIVMFVILAVHVAVAIAFGYGWPA